MIDVEVRGVREALNTLAQFDKELVKELRIDLAQVAGPLTTAIRGSIPILSTHRATIRAGSGGLSLAL